jgi:hypothetical protein
VDTISLRVQEVQFDISLSTYLPATLHVTMMAKYVSQKGEMRILCEARKEETICETYA